MAQEIRLLDLSQYQGDNQAQVRAGWEIVKAFMPPHSRNTACFARIVRVATYIAVAVPTDAGLVSYLAFADPDGAPHLTQRQAVLVMEYLRANDQALRVIRRLQ